MSGSLRALIEVTKLALKETGPVESRLAMPRRLLDELEAEDLGLASHMEAYDRSAPWSCRDLYGDSELQLSLFIVPKGNVMPLHDHPGMAVLFRVLWGTLQVKAYDWAREYPLSGLARESYDLSLDGGDPSLLIGSESGNVHTIAAVEEAAFLDVLMPPYDPERGRECHYYRERRWVGQASERLMELEVMPG